MSGRSTARSRSAPRGSSTRWSFPSRNLQASATEDEIAAEMAVAKTTTTVAAFTRKRPAERNTFPDHLPRERAGDRSAGGVRVLRRNPAAQAGRGRDPDPGGGPASVEGGRDRAGEVHLPGLREDQPGAGAVPCDPARMGGVPASWR